MCVELDIKLCSLQLTNQAFLVFKGLKGTAFHGKPVSKLLSVVCRVGSYSVTCHLVNTGELAPSLLQPNRPVLNLLTPEG